MHTIQEYRDLLNRIFVQAGGMVNCLPSAFASSGSEVLEFLKQYGYEGFPTTQAGKFYAGSWLNRPGRPNNQHEGVIVIPFFSDDALPPTFIGLQNFAEFFPHNQSIVLLNVDHWSVPELAMFLLHEMRHARHLIGPKIAGLSPLDQSNEKHEGYTWIFIMNVLIAWGGSVWRSAVQKEFDWLSRQDFGVVPPGEIIYRSSKIYRDDLDDLFGSTSHDTVRRFRNQLVSINAHMEYWPRKNPAINREGVCGCLVSQIYK